MIGLLDIIGKKIISIKGEKLDKRRKSVSPKYIMLDDGKTFIELEEQDYYTYHDCSMFAREIRIYENEKRWERMMNDESGFFCDATEGNLW